MDVTAVITSYNESRYISEAIESVLAQTHEPEEILLVDAGSTDGSREIIQRYAERHPVTDFVFLEGDPNIPEMRNAALSEVSTDLVTFLDGDDRFREEKIERELATYRSNHDAAIVFSNVSYIEEHGDMMGRWCDSDSPPTGTVLYENAMRQWPKGSLYRNELVSADLIRKVGKYDQDLPIYEDWDLKIRLAPETEVAYCPSTLVEYRQHSEGISARSDPDRYVETIRRILEKNRDLFKRELPSDKRRKVESSMRGRIKRYEAIANLEEGDVSRALIDYLRYLKLHPPAVTNYKQHLRFILPTGVYNVLKKLYRNGSRRSG